MIFLFKKLKSSYHCCCCSAAQSWTAWFKNLMDRSTPGFPVHRHLPELAQTHVHRVSDVIQPSHPLSPPSPPAFNLSQHQGLFKWVSLSQQLAKVLEFQLQQSILPMNIQDWFALGWTGWINLLAVQGLSRVFSNTIVQKYRFFGAQLYSPILTSLHDYRENDSLD